MQQEPFLEPNRPRGDSSGQCALAPKILLDTDAAKPQPQQPQALDAAAEKAGSETRMLEWRMGGCQAERAQHPAAARG